MAFADLPGKVVNRWQSLTPPRKTALVLLMLALISAVIYLAPMIERAGYAPLFTKLDPKEAGAIVEKLNSMKVKYQLTDQGQTIMVPKSEVYDVRIRLASSGALEGSNKGFELFDQKKLGITDFEQQIFYQRALQEELRRTITQLEGVQQARVHLVLPQKSVFLDDKGTASASVALKMKPLEKLKPEQIKGISDLVSGSVEGLKPENIHIIDMDGRILSDEVKEASNASIYQKASDQQQVKRTYEKEMEKRVQEVLERVLGPGKAVAMVTADLDFSQQQVTTTVPNSASVVLSEKTLTEKDARGNLAGGPAGTDSNLPPSYPGAAGTGTSGDYSREESTKNYQVGTREETIVGSPVNMRRLSIAVVMDGNPGSGQIQTIQNTVAAAVGSDPARGDQIAVTGLAFDNSVREKLDEEMNRAEALAKEAQKQKLYWYLGAAIAGILLFALIVFMLIRLFRSRDVEEEGIVASADGKVVPLKVMEKSLQQLEREEKPSVMSTKQESAKELARKKPEDVAQIIKVWLAED